jgi:hypothetical protein
LDHDLFIRKLLQQPEGGETPGVAAAPVALAGGAMVGLARFIEMLSLHAAVFGVVMTVGAGLMLVSAVSSPSVGDSIIPGVGLVGISGVERGEAAALASAFPGAVVHELPGVVLPSGDAEMTVPVVLPVKEFMIVTGIAAGRLGKRLVDGVVTEPAILVSSDGIVMVPMGLIVAVGLAVTAVLGDVTLCTEGENSTTRGEQFTLVPGIVGSVASGGEASVVTGAPGTVAAEKRLENGPGPLNGEETIAPGVVGSDIAVLPIVDICA